MGERKLATMGTPIVEVTYDEESETWNISRTSTIFYTLIKLRSVDFKFRINEEFDEVTPDKRDVRSIVTVEGDTITRYMTIEKQPDVVGKMKFQRYVDGKVVEQMETSDIDFNQAETLAKSLDK